MGNFCNAQILLDLSKNLEIDSFINKNYTTLFTHSSECIQLNYNKMPKIKDEIEKKEKYKQLIYEYLDKLSFYNDKIVKENIYEIYKDKKFHIIYEQDKINKILKDYKKH